MNINIVSMQRVINQGSFLQAYGLKKMLEFTGAEIRFSDIKPGISNERCAEHFDKEFLGGLTRLYAKCKLHNKLSSQRAMLRKAQIEDLRLDLREFDSPDLTFIGSDEVFNCLAPSSWGITKQLFGDVEGCLRTVAYAASCGHTRYQNIPQEYRDYIRGAISKFERISVRDTNTMEFVSAFGRNAVYNLDPVLIYDFANEIREKDIGCKYLLIYSYSGRLHDAADIKAIKSFAKQKGLKTVAAGEMQYWCDINLAVHPFELLGLFKNAEYVLMDTFHGAVLSIKYEKNFVCLIRPSNKNKLQDLLERLAQTDRMITSVEQMRVMFEKAPDFNETREIIEKGKSEARKYIQDCVK